MADLDPSLLLQLSTVFALIAAGATEQSRNRGPTVDRTQWFDQCASAELKRVLATSRLGNEATPRAAAFIDLVDMMM